MKKKIKVYYKKIFLLSFILALVLSTLIVFLINSVKEISQYGLKKDFYDIKSGEFLNSPLNGFILMFFGVFSVTFIFIFILMFFLMTRFY